MIKQFFCIVKAVLLSGTFTIKVNIKYSHQVAADVGTDIETARNFFSRFVE